MSDLQKEVRLHLGRSDAVTELVPVARISTGGQLPDDTEYPAIVLQADEDTEIYLDGAQGLQEADLSVLLLTTETTDASAVAELEAIRAAVKTALHGLRGAIGEISLQGLFYRASGEVEIDPDTGLVALNLQFHAFYS